MIFCLFVNELWFGFLFICVFVVLVAGFVVVVLFVYFVLLLLLFLGGVVGIS